MRTTRSGSEKGRLRRKRSRIKLKIAVFMPMPSASVSTASNVNAGDLRSWRRAKRMSFNMEVIPRSGSFGSQRDDWIDAGSSARWHAAGNQRDEHQRNYGCD